MTQLLTPARVVSPGQIIRRELEARDWTQKDLAHIMDRPPQVISEIIKGKKQITPLTALELAAAFDTSPELWLNLETNYQLHVARRRQSAKSDISRRSRLYNLLPIAELIKLGWLEAAATVDDLERAVCAFLNIASIQTPPTLVANFRYGQHREPDVNAQIAWLKRAERLSRPQKLPPFDRNRLLKAMPGLLRLAQQAEDSSGVPEYLLNLGLHFVIVPHLPQTYLDGAAFYLEGQPVVALTLRYDRIDSFWFTLLHELAHIALGHEGIYLDNLENSPDTQENTADPLNKRETAANQQARQWLINREAMTAFVQQTTPYFSRAKIEAFAEQQQRHPGLILGILQHDQVVEFKHLRHLLVKISPYLEKWIDRSLP